MGPESEPRTWAKFHPALSRLGNILVPIKMASETMDLLPITLSIGE